MADPGKSESKTVPPYVPFKTLKTFLESLRVAIPSRIDRSVMASMSGATQSQLTSALRYLGLVSENGIPSERLTQLVHAEGAEWQQKLRELLTDKYSFLFGDFDLTRATSRQFEEAFNATGTSAETAKKCMGFFLSAAKDADLKLSPHIKPYRATKGAARPRRPVTPTIDSPENGSGGEIPSTTPWAQLLLSKFPSFDPAWPDDVKAKWFDAFAKLMKSGGSE
jgi:hypothetical protein